MDYKIIKTEDDLKAERESWNQISAYMKDSTPFQTWEWNYIWWKNNEPANSLFVIKAFEGKKVYGYAPIVVKDNRAEFIGGKDMDFGRFVVAEKEMVIIQGFVSLLLEQGYDLLLQEMASRNTQLHMVEKLLEDNKRHLFHKTTRAAYVELDQYDSFENYFKLLSKSMRNKTIKVGLKKNLILQKETISNELMIEIKEIYASRQEARVGESTIEWAIPVIQEMNREGLLNIYVARDEKKAVGFLISMNYLNAQYLLLVAFRQEYKNCFPGQLLFYQAIKDGFADGNVKVDFMRGDYDFKMRWECKIDTNYTVYLFHSSKNYWKHKIFFAIKPKVKKLIYKHSGLERIYRKYAK